MQKEDELINVKYNVTIEVKNLETGECRNIKVHNLVTDLGKHLIRDFLKNDSVEGMKYFAIGTGVTASSVSDEILESEVYRDTFTDVLIEGNKVTFKYYLGSQEANGNILTEAGLFGNTATSDINTGVLFARFLNNPIEKNTATGVTYSWEIIIN